MFSKRLVRLSEICRRANVKCPLQDLCSNRVDPEMEDDAKEKVKRGADTAAVKRFMDDRRDKTKKEKSTKKSLRVPRKDP